MAAVLTALLGHAGGQRAGHHRATSTPSSCTTCGSRCGAPAAALKLAGQVLPPGPGRGSAPEFKWLGDLTTLTRDLDVYLLGLPEMTAGLVGAPPGGPGPVRRAPAAQRAPGPPGPGSAGCARPGSPRLRQDWRDALDAAAERPRRKPPAAAPGRRPASPPRTARCWPAAPRSPPTRRPSACTTCASAARSCATLLEIFASLHAPDAQWRAVKELKGLQDCLGEYQDTEVQRAELRAFAAQMMAEQSAPARDAAGHGRDRGRAGRGASAQPGPSSTGCSGSSPARRARPGSRR